MSTVFGSSTWDTVHSQCSHCSSNSEAETILNRGNVMVHTDTKQRQKGITGYFTFLYNTFQNHDLMPAWKAKWRPWDKAGSFVYTRFGLTFRSVSVLAPIFRKYPLSRWWICLVSDPSPKLHSVPVWMDELNPPGLDLSSRWPGSCTAPPSLCPTARGPACCTSSIHRTGRVMWRAVQRCQFC